MQRGKSNVQTRSNEWREGSTRSVKGGDGGYPYGMKRGIYIAIFHVSRTQAITIGRLGRFAFRHGYYFYVGSAQRGLQARLARHARRNKPLRWQIDYLSSKAPMVRALMIEGPKNLECRLAAMLARHYPRPIPRFGASDCRCGGH